MIHSILNFAQIIILVLSIALVVKIFNGKTIIEKVMVAVCIDILLGIFMVLYGVNKERAIFIDLGLIVTLLGFLGTILVCKYLEGKL